MSAPILRALALIGLAVLLAVPLFVAGAYFKFLLILVFIYSIVAPHDRFHSTPNR
jgi:hypothetical protein